MQNKTYKTKKIDYFILLQIKEFLLIRKNLFHKISYTYTFAE